MSEKLELQTLRETVNKVREEQGFPLLSGGGVTPEEIAYLATGEVTANPYEGGKLVEMHEVYIPHLAVRPKTFKTINQTRKEQGLSPLIGGDVTAEELVFLATGKSVESFLTPGENVELQKEAGGLPLATINNARKAQGLDPLELTPEPLLDAVIIQNTIRRDFPEVYEEIEKACNEIVEFHQKPSKVILGWRVFPNLKSADPYVAELDSDGFISKIKTSCGDLDIIVDPLSEDRITVLYRNFSSMIDGFDRYRDGRTLKGHRRAKKGLSKVIPIPPTPKGPVEE